MATISIYKIKSDLDKLSSFFDMSKCTIDIHAISGGYSFDVKTHSDEYCPFHIDISSDVFDIIIANQFALGDIEHSDFDFNDIAMSVASGRVLEIENRGLWFRRRFLEINLDNGCNFYVPGRLNLFRINKPHTYLGYIL